MTRRRAPRQPIPIAVALIVVVVIGASRGESRSSDANGQFFKVLGTGGLETLSLGNGLFGSTASNMRGVNPPPQPTRPPLEADQPCENQEVPDLRTNPGVPPESVPTNNGSAAVRERTAKAQSVAVEVLRDQLRARGDKTKVLDEAVTRDELLAGLRALRARAAGK